jgi:hypothetical protein
MVPQRVCNRSRDGRQNIKVVHAPPVQARLSGRCGGQQKLVGREAHERRPLNEWGAYVELLRRDAVRESNHHGGTAEPHVESQRSPCRASRTDRDAHRGVQPVGRCQRRNQQCHRKQKPRRWCLPRGEGDTGARDADDSKWRGDVWSQAMTGGVAPRMPQQHDRNHRRKDAEQCHDRMGADPRPNPPERIVRWDVPTPVPARDIANVPRVVRSRCSTHRPRSLRTADRRRVGGAPRRRYARGDERRNSNDGGQRCDENRSTERAISAQMSIASDEEQGGDDRTGEREQLHCGRTERDQQRNEKSPTGTTS